MLNLPNLDLLNQKALEYFTSKEENILVYKTKTSCSLKTLKFRVEMFPQIWSNTCLGFDVDKNGKACIGGDAITEVYTVVFYEPITEIYLVFFDDRFCYQVKEAKEVFLEDLKNHQLESLSRALKFY